MHPERDILIVRLRSPLLFDGRLGVDLKFPGVARKLNPDPADWEHPEAHATLEVARGPGGLTLTRQIDDTHYSVKLTSDRELDIETPGPHVFRFSAPGSTQLTLLVEFTEGPPAATLPDAEIARASGGQMVGRLLDERRRGGFHGQQTSQGVRARAAHRAVAIPHRGEFRGRAAAAGRGPVLQ